MKNKTSIVTGKPGIVSLCLLAIATTLIHGCNNKHKLINTSFYYAGDTTIEISIMADTLGILLRDTVLNPLDTSTFYFTAIQRMANDSLSTQGYDSAGTLEGNAHVKLVINPTGTYSKRVFLEEVAKIKNPKNRVFVENAGFLVREKKTNKPMILINEIIVQFKPGTSAANINALFNNYHLTLLRRSRFDSLQYVVAITMDSPNEILQMSHVLKNNSLVQFAEINFVISKKYLSVIPTDAMFSSQWQLVTGRTGATDDADIDADLAWDFTMGSPRVIIAVIDAGFDTLHYDLDPNFTRNTGETQGNGIDDDNNGFLDDYFGWNFDGNDNNLDGYEHGTAVLGLANAAANNDNLGIAGSCPGCRSLLIKSGHTPEDDADAIYYAILRGAKIINCSWEYGTAVPSVVLQAINRAITAGISVIFAMSNDNLDYCARSGFNVIEDVILVSRSTSKDSYDQAGWGSCMALLVPAGVFGSPIGYLKLLTTDIRGERGYNTGANNICATEINNLDYTNCFWGTSAAAPITAGVAGLVASENSNLTPKQVRYLLQDCADKIENSVGHYLAPKANSPTHGYGRLNAYEAVKIASSNVDRGGRNGVDIFMRDNVLDWGNTEKPSSYLFEPIRGTQPFWVSEDIKVDGGADQIPANIDNNFFEEFRDQKPIGGQNNKVYVRVRNRGFRTSSEITVKLFWVHAGATLPPLPSDFWNRFPLDPLITSDWNSLGTRTISSIDYCGPSIVDSPFYNPKIVSFDFNAPVHDPSTRNHYCLMAIISSTEDPMPTSELRLDPQRFNMDYVTTHFNNATHRNYNIETADGPFTTEFFLYNSLASVINTKLTVSFKGQTIPVILPDSLQQGLIYLKKGDKKLVKCKIDATGLREPTEIIIQQMIPGKNKDVFDVVIGGLNYYIFPSKK